MADTTNFALTDPVFSDPNLQDMLTQAEIDLINASPLLKSLLHEYYSNLGKPILHDTTADSSGYDPDPDRKTINIKQTGSDFVRVLGHELTHYFDHTEGSLGTKRENFSDIITREMDESEATAASFIIRRQIMANHRDHPDIRISNRIDEYDPDPDRDIIAVLDRDHGSKVTPTMTIDDFWPLTQEIAKKTIWGMNFHTRPHGSTNRWEDALNEAFFDIPGFLQTNVRTFKSARINDDGKYEFIFTEAQGANAGQEIKYVYGLNSSSGDDQPNLLVVGDTDHSLLGGSGDDVLVGNWTREGAEDTEGDLMDGGAGNDTFYTGKGYDILRGGTGNDTFIIQGEDTDYDVFYGGADTDSILGGDGFPYGMSEKNQSALV